MDVGVGRALLGAWLVVGCPPPGRLSPCRCRSGSSWSSVSGGLSSTGFPSGDFKCSGITFLGGINEVRSEKELTHNKLLQYSIFRKCLKLLYTKMESSQLDKMHKTYRVLSRLLTASHEVGKSALFIAGLKKVEVGVNILRATRLFSAKF